MDSHCEPSLVVNCGRSFPAQGHTLVSELFERALHRGDTTLTPSLGSLIRGSSCEWEPRRARQLATACARAVPTGYVVAFAQKKRLLTSQAWGATDGAAPVQRRGLRRPARAFSGTWTRRLGKSFVICEFTDRCAGHARGHTVLLCGMKERVGGPCCVVGVSIAASMGWLSGGRGRVR